MPSPNAEKALSIGQDKTYKDATEMCDALKGKYDGSRAKMAKPKNAGPGTLPNQPSPFTLKG